MSRRAATPLTIRRVQTESRLGLHADGNSLYLYVGKGTARSWIFRYQTADGRRHDLGLGPAGPAGVTLAEAREQAIDLKRAVRRGADPIADKEQQRVERRPRVKPLTFAEAAQRYIDAHEAGWKDKRAWPDSMRLYAYPQIAGLAVADVDVDAVMRVLQPIWGSKTKAAGDLRGRLEMVLDWATVNKHREEGPNPARWRGHLDKLLPKPSRIARVEHHKALLYAEVPAFMAELRQHEGVAAAALEFVVLTATRAGEALGARWSEVDMPARVWTIPPERMKAGKQFRVPLADPSMEVLDRLASFRSNQSDNLFLGWRLGRPMSASSLLQCLQRMRPGATTHGFRSAFRDWAADQTDFPAELAEMALAHQVGSRVARAYRRGDGLDQRRVLADRWAAFCGTA